MPIVSYYAYFNVDYRPRAKPDPESQKQPVIFAGTKISVKEEFLHEGEVWCQIWAPPAYTPGVGYPELWVPKTLLMLEAPDIEEPPVEAGDVPDEVVQAVITLLKWFKT